jgi:hypothetical protein
MVPAVQVVVPMEIPAVLLLESAAAVHLQQQAELPDHHGSPAETRDRPVHWASAERADQTLVIILDLAVVAAADITAAAAVAATVITSHLSVAAVVAAVPA